MEYSENREPIIETMVLTELYEIWSEKEKAYIPPVRPQEIAIDGNISNYQKLRIKKAFLKLINEQNEYFNVKMGYGTC